MQWPDCPDSVAEEFALPSQMEGGYSLPMVYPLNTKQCGCGVRYHAAECPRCKRERENRDAYCAEQRRRQWGWQAVYALILLACMVAAFFANLWVIRW